MVVDASDEPKMVDDMDEDEEPLVFKRSSSSTTKQQLSKSEAKRGSQVSQERSQNGQSASGPKSKAVPPVKTPPGRSPLASPTVSISSTEVSGVVHSKTVLQSCGSRSDHTKSKMQQMKDGNPSKPRNKSFVNSDDSEDEKPLSARISPLKTQSNNPEKRMSATASSQKPKIPKPENFDSEIPSSKFQAKFTAGTSAGNVSGSVEKKPLLSKHGQNGSSSTEMKLTSNLKKRPAESVESTADLKRPKLSDASTSNKSKETSFKSEMKEEEDEDHVPISQRVMKLTSSEKKPASLDKKPSLGKMVSKPAPSSSKITSKIANKSTKSSEYSKSSMVPPGSGEGQKWTTLVHNGVIFPPPYKPHGVKMLYKGKPVQLTPEQEEVATMFAVMLETDYMSKAKFRENFMADWRKILGKNHVIQDLEYCDFTPIYEWHQKEKEKKKQMSAEEKKAIKEEKMKQEEKYMWAIVDGVKEKVGNFRVEPPGLFRGRGEHPKMGKLKKRIRPNDIIINIGKDAPIPECPIPGESWKEIRHDNTVTWLAYWSDPINPKMFKYVFLAPSSTLKGQSDKEKYEKARLLKEKIASIRAAYTKDFTSKDLTKKQIAVATYLIDKLALRAGNEKDDDEADTVGCCTLKVENVEPVPPNKLKFDFLGKDSIRYQNEVEVEPAVFKAVQQFRSGKKGGDDLFDKLDTAKLNSHLKELMPGLTAKVFRTYNASITLDDMLNRDTNGGDIAEKVVIYNRANKQVAIICNHQRSVSKSHSAQMLRIDEKIEELRATVEELKTDLARAKKGKPPLKSPDGKTKKNLNPDALERKISQATKRLEKLELDKATKDELKTVALGTSKINYLDPRITVAWCKREEVPIEKMFNKSLLAKFAWAMDIDPSFRF